MRSGIRIAGVVAALVLCAASATGYRESYKDTSLGGGRWLVSVSVTNKTGMSTAQQYAYKRAAEVCGGRGFDVLDGAADTENKPYAISTTTGATQGTAQAHCSSGLGGSTCYGTYTPGSPGTTTTITGNAGHHEVVLYYQCRTAGGAAARSGGSLFDGQ